MKVGSGTRGPDEDVVRQSRRWPSKAAEGELKTSARLGPPPLGMSYGIDLPGGHGEHAIAGAVRQTLAVA